MQHGGVARDDDGNSLGAETETLQVCHIIPFSLTSHKSKEDRDSDVRHPLCSQGSHTKTEA